MKKLLLILLIASIPLSAQFKEQPNNAPSIKSGILSGNSNSLFGFINPDNFSMHHTFNMSYTAAGSFGMALGAYTNSMAYKLTDNLNVETDISVVNSPYNSMNSKEFANQFNGVYLSRAQINYKPSENMTIMLQYRQLPAGSFYPYSYYGNNSFYGNNPFYRDNFFNDPFGRN